MVIRWSQSINQCLQRKRFPSIGCFQKSLRRTMNSQDNDQFYEFMTWLFIDTRANHTLINRLTEQICRREQWAA